jgi:hypothetical protein
MFANEKHFYIMVYLDLHRDPVTQRILTQNGSEVENWKGYGDTIPHCKVG